MKYTKKILILPALSILLTSASPSIKPTISTISIYGPFTGEENVPIYMKSSSSSFEVHGTADIYNNKNGSYLFSRTIDIVYPYDTPFNLDLKGRITASGVRVDLNLTGDKNFKMEESIVLYPPKRNTITSSIGSVTFEGCLFQLKKSALILNEKYDFASTNNLVSSDNENKITLNETIFNYTPIGGYRYKSAELQITDYEGVYPGINSEGNIKKIPLNIVTNNSEVSFEINSGLYVNYANMEMSSTYLLGYETTNDLYVPFGKEDKLSRNEFKIVIYESGYNLSTVEIPLEYFNFMRLFGECGESDYCIHGGIRQ